eukprot:scaffold3659_cov51-Phaeocystis_antarctica.AAC.1
MVLSAGLWFTHTKRVEREGSHEVSACLAAQVSACLAAFALYSLSVVTGPLLTPPLARPRRRRRARRARRLRSSSSLRFRSRQLAAAQPGCPSLDPHATCSEARPQGLATPQLVSHFLLGARYGGRTVPVSRQGSEHQLAARLSHADCRHRCERGGLARNSLRIHGCVEPAAPCRLLHHGRAEQAPHERREQGRRHAQVTK